MLDDCRHIFNGQAQIIATCCIFIGGNRDHGYTSRVNILPDRSLQGTTPDKIIEEILEERYPDILGLCSFLDANPTLSPFSLTFINACAKAALSLPPIFDEDRMIFLKLFPNDNNIEPDPVLDSYLVRNAQISYQDEGMIFAQDLPVLTPGKTSYLSHDI